MRLPFPGERNLRGPLDLLRRVWRDTLDQPDPGDLSGKVRRALSVPFVDYARGDGPTVGPGRRPSGRRSSSPTRTPGSTAIAACGASTPVTGSPASGRRPARSTRGPGRSASRGPTRSGSPGSPRSRRRRGRRPCSSSGSSELERERDDVRREAEAIAAELPGLSEEVAALRGAVGLDHYADGAPDRAPGGGGAARRRSGHGTSS